MTRAFKLRPRDYAHKLDGRIVVQVDDRFYVLSDDTLEPLDWELTDVWSRMPDEGNSVWIPV